MFFSHFFKMFFFPCINPLCAVSAEDASEKELDDLAVVLQTFASTVITRWPGTSSVPKNHTEHEKGDAPWKPKVPKV